MDTKIWTASAVAAAAFIGLAGASASAAPLIPAVFNFTVGNNDNLSDGNARIFSATSAQFGSFQVRATAWSLETIGNDTFVRDSKLMVYDKGLGVISGDDQNGDNAQHTVDNSKRRDFILFQFNRPVQLISATFNTFNVLGGAKDSDATLKYGQTLLPWNGGLNLNNQNVTALNAMFNGTYTSFAPTTDGASNTRDINTSLFGGNFWLIGADFINTDGKIDGFKLTNLAVIPEPATWAMMVGGFALLGAAMRRRVSQVRVSA